MKRLLKKDLEKFKKLLIAHKEKIFEELKAMADSGLSKSQREASGDISSYTYHMADLATDNYDREFSLDLASNERKLLFEIEEALKRIDEGTYGLCMECGNRITKTRLKAVPHTALCRGCQEKSEKERRIT
jgi:RNA polymerase-binding protein DksA